MMQNGLTQRTRLAYARIAGAMFLLYIAAGIPAMILFNRAAAGENAAAKLASIGEHASEVKVAVLLSLLICFIALVLATALYVITRDADPNLALLVLICRVAEGILNAFFIVATLGLLWLGTTMAAAGETGGVNTATATALGSFLLKAQDRNTVISATFFSVGSMVFSYLLLRYRMIPGSLALLGLIASILLVVYLPLQLVGFFGGSSLGLIVWLPMLVFEVVLAAWLLVKGVDLRMGEIFDESPQN
jgi:hypothetical protein